jgi:phage gp37-like protein
MAYTTETVEDAILTALAALKTSLDVRTIKTYQEELDEKNVKTLALALPAIFVVYGGSVWTAHGRRKTEHFSFHLFVCDKNLRKEEESRRGSARNPGTYAMLKGVRDLLHGQQLGMEITPFGLVRETPICLDGGISIYAAEYGTAQAHLYPAG